LMTKSGNSNKPNLFRALSDNRHTTSLERVFFDIVFDQ
jgi:hypothetical protein